MASLRSGGGVADRSPRPRARSDDAQADAFSNPPDAVSQRPAWLRRRRWDLIGIAVVCLVIVAGYAEVPFNGKTFSTASTVPGVEPCAVVSCYLTKPGDPRVDRGASAWQNEPSGHLIHQTIFSGEAPLWNPYEGNGMPLAGDMPTGAFDPVALAYRLHPTPLTQDLAILGGLILTGVAAYWCARRFRLGVLAAVVSASVYGLSGWFFTNSNNEWFWTYLYLPLVFGAIEWTFRTKRRLPILVLGLAIAGMVLVGMPELCYIVLVSAAFSSLVRLCMPVVLPRLRTAARLVGGAALGLALSSPVLLLFAQFLPLSQNSHTGLHGGPPADPLASLLNWVMPGISPANGAVYAFSRNWVGAAALFLVVLALASPGAMRRFAGWPLLATGALVGLQVYGGPLVGWTTVIPFWRATDWARYGTPILAFVLAMLAGIGLQALADGRIVWKLAALVGGALALGLVLVALTASRDLALGHNVQLRGGFPLALLVVAVIGIVLARLERRHAAMVVSLLVVVELLVLAPRGFYADRADPFPSTRWTTFLQTRTAIDRSRVLSPDGVLFPNTAGVYQLSDARLLDALYVGRYWDYLRSFVSHGITDRFTATGQAETVPAIAANRMFDLLGIRYVVFRSQSDGPPSGSDPQYRIVFRGGGVKIYENTQVMPRAFVVHKLQRADDERGALRSLRSGEVNTFPDGSVQVAKRDPRRTAVVESDPGDLPRVGSCTGAQDRVAIRKYTTTSVTLDVESRCAGLLVLSDAYYPGWSAEVEGSSVHIYATDVALRGVAVPQGHSTVVFRYRPTTYRVGLGIFFVALLVVGAVLLSLLAFKRGRVPARGIETSPGQTA